MDPDWAGLRARIDQALAAARVAEAVAICHADQTAAAARVACSQVRCNRCFGDLDAADFMASIGTGECTCELRCRRPSCLAGDGMTLGGQAC